MLIGNQRLLLHWLPFQMTPPNLLNCFFFFFFQQALSLWQYLPEVTSLAVSSFDLSFLIHLPGSWRKFLLSWQSSWTNNSSLNPLKIKFLFICGYKLRSSMKGFAENYPPCTYGLDIGSEYLNSLWPSQVT